MIVNLKYPSYWREPVLACSKPVPVSSQKNQLLDAGIHQHDGKALSTLARGKVLIRGFTISMVNNINHHD